MSEPIYSRAPDVVWRLGPDRVLVRRTGGRGEDAAAELIGEAALVWTALDEPATPSGVTARLMDADAGPAARATFDGLVGLGWLRRV